MIIETFEVECFLGTESVYRMNTVFGFFPADAKARDPEAGMDQIRLSFSFNEKFGDERREALRAATRAFAKAMLREIGL